MNNQKGFANIVLIILVVVLTGVAGYFALVKKPATLPTDQSQSTNTPITNTPKNTQPSTAPVSGGPALSVDKKSIVEADINNLADLLNTRVYIAFYYEKYNKYPKIEGNTAEQRWGNLNNLFAKESENLGFNNLISLSQDSRYKEKGFSYDYQASSNQQQAVLKATLEAPDHQDVKTAIEVNHDVDGIVFGIDCNKPNYCLIIR